MKFRYYITDLGEGAVIGTNNEGLAKDYAASCDNFVVDTETGRWLVEDGTDCEVEEAT
jgi:hypothetical protein